MLNSVARLVLSPTRHFCRRRDYRLYRPPPTSLAPAQQDFANQFVLRSAFTTKYAGATTAGAFVDAILSTIQTADAVNLNSQRQALIDQYNNVGGGNPI